MGNAGSPAPAPSGPSQRAGGGPFGRVALAIVAVALLTMLVRVPTFRIPLDQDGSVFAYCATTWAEGGLPYRDAWDHKPPLTYLVYRLLFAVAPPSSVAVNATLRVGSGLCDAATAVLLLLLARRFFGLGVGLVAGLTYGLFTGLPVLQDEAFQPERLTVLFTAAGVLAGAAYADSRKLRYAALSGLLFGLALLAKQIAAPVGVVVWAWVTWEAFRAEGKGALRRVVLHSVLLAAGAALFWALAAAYFAAHGALADFWECTYHFNVVYAREHRKGTLLEGVRRLVEARVFDHAFLWLAGAGGLLVALARRAERRAGLLVGGWALATFAALVLPGQFAAYYYVPTVAPLAVAAAVAVVGLWRLARRRGGLALRVVVVGGSAAVLLAVLAFAVKRAYGPGGTYSQATNPRRTNAVVAGVADYIGARTPPGARVYMRGGRMQVYILSGRRSVTPYLYDFHYNVPPERAYHYKPEKLKAILDALEKHKPPFIVVTKGGKRGEKVTSGAYDELDTRFPAFKRYLAEAYEPDPERPDWPAWPYSLMLFRRKDAP